MQLRDLHFRALLVNEVERGICGGSMLHLPRREISAEGYHHEVIALFREIGLQSVARDMGGAH